MIIILSCIALGMLVGWLLRNSGRAGKIFTRLTDYSIYLLLLCLGISIGTNREIIDNLGRIGMQVLIITIIAMGGSIALAYIVYRVFFKGDGK